ncbi:hypothetical protein [Vagococcus fluvialis]|uniref:Uncharacterized protein n=1 Tax=Vagococcus fluvialis TaxID=2738 RepID=A0A369AZA4_9ENTE|nr:hypothetical protein [Vagococcus fluvialis]MDT2747942.1 hypothetical protein [Vagococcus fluvialis]RCX13668.1 hypothetical protein DFR54_10575 [Vagococcus fluvialis]RSU02251.1 hypothetical protein CBF32_06600 [Vagococcus fluvialis]
MTIKTIKLLFWLLWHIAYFFLLASNDLTQFLEQIILLITAFELTRYYQKQHSLLIMSSVFLGWFIVLQTNLSLLIDLYEKISFSQYNLREGLSLAFLVVLTIIQLINFEKMMSITQNKLYNHFHLFILASATLFVQSVFTYLSWFNLTKISFEQVNVLKGMRQVVTESGSRAIFSTYFVLMICFGTYYLFKKIFLKGEVIHENTYRGR